MLKGVLFEASGRAAANGVGPTFFRRQRVAGATLDCAAPAGVLGALRAREPFFPALTGLGKRHSGSSTGSTTGTTSSPAPVSQGAGEEGKARPPTAVVMLNMGGPATPEAAGPFLTRLFSDPMIINLGRLQWLGAWAARRRTPKIEAQYRAIGGSPIRRWTELQGAGLCAELDRLSPATAPHKPYVMFRYADPLTDEALAAMRADGVQRAVAFSQYPMHSCTTTGSSLTHLWERLEAQSLSSAFKWSVIDRWHDHPLFVRAVARRVQLGLQQFPAEDRSKVLLLFSAHSVPVKTVDRGDHYAEEVAQTVGLVAREVQRATGTALPHILAWQSKVGFLPWLSPSTADTIKSECRPRSLPCSPSPSSLLSRTAPLERGAYLPSHPLTSAHSLSPPPPPRPHAPELGATGRQHVLTVPIAFTSDHVETLYEIDIEYAHLARESGVAHFKRAPSLNEEPLLQQALATIAAEHIASGRAVKEEQQYRMKCLDCTNPLCRTVVNPVAQLLPNLGSA